MELSYPIGGVLCGYEVGTILTDVNWSIVHNSFWFSEAIVQSLNLKLKVWRLRFLTFLVFSEIVGRMNFRNWLV